MGMKKLLKTKLGKPTPRKKTGKVREARRWGTGRYQNQARIRRWA